MGDSQEGSSKPVSEDKGTKRKPSNKSKGKRSRADGGSSAKDDPSDKDINGGAEKHKGSSRADKSKDSSDKGSKGKNSGKRKKSKVDIEGGDSGSGDGTRNRRSSSRLEGTDAKNNHETPSRSRTQEEAKTWKDEQNLGSSIVGVPPANVVKELSEPTSKKAESSDAPNALSSRAVDDGVGEVSSPQKDEPESSSVLLSEALGDYRGKDNRRPQNISTPAANEPATGKRRASKADDAGANEPTSSARSSTGRASAEEMAEHIGTVSRQQSSSRVPKSKRKSKDQKRKERRGTFTAATVVSSSQDAEGDGERIQEISAEEISPPPAFSTPAIATNATSHHTAIGAGKRASDRGSNGGGHPESANDETKGEASDANLSADVTTPPEPTNDTEQEEATPPSRESVADVSQLAVSNSQDMQDDMVCLTASPAGSEEGRVDNENPGAVDKRRPPAVRRRSESADGSAPLNLNEAGGRAAAIQGPELGVQVIDEGTTKQLVLTTTTGHRPAGAFNHDAPQEPAKTFANSPAPRFVHGRRKSNGVIDPDDEIARSIAFRERFSAVLLGEQDIDPPFTGVDGISPAATKSKTPYDVPRPRSVEHDEHAPAFQQREGHSTSLSPRVVSSPQVDRYASGEQRPPPPTPPIPGSVDGNISDLLRPSEIMSPSLPECVQEQVSFHDVLPSGYGQQSLRTVSFRREDCSRTIPTSQTMPVVSHEGTTRSTSEHTDSLTAVQTGNRGQSYERQEPRQQDMQVCVDFPDGAGGDAKQSVLGSRDQADPGLEKDSAKGETPFGDSEADSKGPLLHFRSDFTRQLADGNRPAIFFLRSNEGLAVTRVEGSGRLLVTLRVEAGEGVLVDDAIVYDSAADFAHSATLTDHRFPYVEGHRYEFRVVPTQGIALTARRRESIEPRERAVHECDDSSQRETVPHGRTEAVHTGLQVSFSIVAAYKANDRLRSADAMRLCAPPIEKGSILSRFHSPALQARKGATSPPPARSVSRDPSPRMQQSSRCDSGKRRRGPPASPSTLASPRSTSPVVAGKNDTYTSTTARCASKPTQTLSLETSPRPEERRPLGNGDGLTSNVGGTAEGGMLIGGAGPKGYDAGSTGPASSLIRYEKRRDDGENFSPVAQPVLTARASVASTCEGQFPPVQRIEGTNRGAMWACDSEGPPIHRNHNGGQLFPGRPPPFVDSDNPYSLRNNHADAAHVLPGRTDLPAGGKEGDWTRERQTIQLRWNPAWEGESMLSSYQAPIAPFAHQPLPLVQRHTDASPRSRYCGQEERQYCPGQDRACGAHLAPPHWPTTMPVDRRGSEGQHRVDRPARQGQRQQQSGMPAGVHPPLQHSAAAPYDSGLGRRGIADSTGPPPRGFVAAGGQRRVMDRHTRPWETSSGINGPLSSRPLGQHGWTNRTNALSAAEGFSPQWARKGDGSWKMDESTGVGTGFPGDCSAADDERRRRGWEGDENISNSSHLSSGARHPGHHNVRLDSFGPMAGQVQLASYREAPAPPRPTLVNTNERHRGVTDEGFAPTQHGYRHSGSDNPVVPGDGIGNTRAEEKSPRDLRGGEQPRYSLNTMIELGRKRPPHRARAAAREQSTYARPRRNRQLNGKGMGQTSVGNNSSVRQATPPRWLKC